MRSMLAGVAETGSETAQRLERLFSTTHPPLPRSPLSHKRGLIKINRGSAAPLLFDLLSYLLSQKTRLTGGFFVSVFFNIDLLCGDLSSYEYFCNGVKAFRLI